MSIENNDIVFAPKEKSPWNEIHLQKNRILNHLVFKTVIDAMPQNFLILNRNHQAVYGNQSLFKLLNLDETQVLGRRPGEFFNCVNCASHNSSCGNSEACMCCGALDAVIRGIRGEEILQECRIRLENSETLNLNVWVKQIHVENEIFVILILFDISNKKKKEIMERIFLHDVLNTAGGILGYTQKLQNQFGEIKTEVDRESIEILQKLMLSMVEQIREQKLLLAAEKENISPVYDKIDSLALMKEILSLYKNHVLAENRKIRIEDQSESLLFKSDHVLIHRILCNMMLNALEASHDGDTILMKSDLKENQIRFSMTNPGVIPKAVQNQIFQRAFSTKGEGRGQGSYSMKLLSQRYLNGDITFISSEKTETVFTLTLPFKPLEEENDGVEYHAGEESGSADNPPGILIVDNSNANCEILRYILDIQGYKSDTIQSVKSAMDCLKERNYKVVLMDMNMPDLSGPEAFRLIRSNHEFDQIPVIALSGRNPPHEVKGLFCMDDLICKPFQTDQVNRVVTKWMRRK